MPTLLGNFAAGTGLVRAENARRCNVGPERNEPVLPIGDEEEEGEEEEAEV